MQYALAHQLNSGSLSKLDPSAKAYITAVETADGQALEGDVKKAINKFVLGCKSDGLWNNITNACILAGARTLNGILVDLKSATTIATQSNFVSADYNRKTGLIGNGTNKVIDTNISSSSISQNNNHIAVEIHTASTANNYMGIDGITTDYTINRSGVDFRMRNLSGGGFAGGSATQTGFAGHTRASSTTFDSRLNSINTNNSATSVAPPLADIGVFAAWSENLSAFGGFSNGRLRYYTFGLGIGSTGLANYESRISTLMTELAAAIP